MRYVKHASYDEETLDVAEALFERFVGRRLAVDFYTERIKVEHNAVVVKHTPIVKVARVRALTTDYPYCDALGPTDLCDVDVSHVDKRNGRLLLPPTLFGTSYTLAEVAYYAGLSEIPPDAERVVTEIADLVSRGAMDQWSGEQALSNESRATIERLRGDEQSHLT